MTLPARIRSSRQGPWGNRAMRDLGIRAVSLGHAVGLECHHCDVRWVGCAAECCCPECGAPKDYHETGACMCEACQALTPSEPRADEDITADQLAQRRVAMHAEQASWSGAYPWRQCANCYAQVHVGGVLYCNECIASDREPAKPLVVREWRVDDENGWADSHIEVPENGKWIALDPELLVAEHNAAMQHLVAETNESYRLCREGAEVIKRLEAELRSRPTREEFEDVKADAVRRHHDACDLQERIWALEANLAASEAEVERLKHDIERHLEALTSTVNAYEAIEAELKASEAERERLEEDLATVLNALEHDRYEREYRFSPELLAAIGKAEASERAALAPAAEPEDEEEIPPPNEALKKLMRTPAPWEKSDE